MDFQESRKPKLKSAVAALRRCVKQLDDCEEFVAAAHIQMAIDLLSPRLVEGGLLAK